jgi:biopolymer transport protein ExbB
MYASLLLLAAVEKTTNAVTNSAAIGNVTAVKTSLADWIVQGGIMMVPIILGSIIALAIIIERAIYLRKVRIEMQRFMDKITRVVGANRIMEAMVICDNTTGPMAAIVKSAIALHDRSREEIREAVEETASREVAHLERYLPALGTIGSVSPLLGLLGTVLGMIKSSNHLAIAGTSNPVGLIGGISEALITTAAGLFVAIPVVVCHNWFTNRVNMLVIEMETRTTEILDLIARSKPSQRGRGDKA